MQFIEANGAVIPAIGLGTWELRERICSRIVEQALRLLRESVQDLLLECASALRDIILWLERINANRFQTCLGRKKDLRFDAVRDIADAKLRLWDSLSEFRESKRCVLKLDLLEFSKFIDAICFCFFLLFPDLERHILLGPYMSSNSVHINDEAPPHRYLFQCFVYQYHLIQFATRLCNIVRSCPCFCFHFQERKGVCLGGRGRGLSQDMLMFFFIYISI